MIYDCETHEELVTEMQALINTGQAWQMEGSIGRSAMDLIVSGECLLGEVGTYGAYGNYVPSRTEVKAGTKGSVEYQQKMMSERA